MKPNKWFPIIGLIITTLLIFWRINDNYVSFTDELLFEEASYRMAFTNQWIVPINDNQAWLEKPPLYFWLTAPIFRITNQFTSLHPLTNNLLPNGEFIYPWIRRFWTDISGVIIIILTYKIAQQLFNKKKGILAGILLLASPLFLSTTKTASLDLTATMWMTATIYIYLKTKKTNPTNLQLLIMGILTALGILTRSFLAFTPLAIILIDQIFNKKNKWKFKQWAILIGTIFVFVFPWHYAIYRLYPQEFIQTYLDFKLISTLTSSNTQ